MLEFDKISYTYHTRSGETAAVRDLSFKIENGQFVSVIGPSGCGKSTILSLAAGLLSPSSGKIIRGSGEFGYMLQRDALFEWRTVNRIYTCPWKLKSGTPPKCGLRLLPLPKSTG